MAPTLSAQKETVTMLAPSPPPGMRWAPCVGAETASLLETLNLPKASQATLQAEALQILGRCVPPNEPAGTETGLVVGYVQSGKTMSFTTVAALARDNDYHLIIVIAGTSKPLLSQSTDRLVTDLRIHSRKDRRWHHLSTGNWDADPLRKRLLEWQSDRVPVDERRTVLITVMKNHVHLDKVIHALRQIDTSRTPTLVIDDEADQASLNTLVMSADQSRTYQRILTLRSLLPHHSFLQYTATPQAPLLINIIDALSPRFVRVLTPGPGYTGGKEFFIDSAHLAGAIPQAEIPSEDNEIADAPESLLEAMRLFFVGVAAGKVLKDSDNRSMMVHPSQQRDGHRLYFDWVSCVRDTWERLLAPSANEADRRAQLKLFERSYKSLSKTTSNLPAWSEVATRLYHAILATKVVEVNARRGSTPKIDWKAEYAHILVGGQAMDRGFTVEGLTVTYMPRPLGIGNADTVQQRARFFGYKGAYLGYCRVYLPSDVRDAYAKYVRHEEDIRDRLLRFSATNEPLSEWKRVFHLDPGLRPCRQSVLDLESIRQGAEKEWYEMECPYLDAAAVKANRTSVRSFLGALKLAPDKGSAARKQATRHNVGVTKLSLVVSDLLTNMQIPHPADSQRFTTLSLMLRELIDARGDADCVVYEMSQGTARERSVDDKGRIKNLFQGAVPVAKRERGRIYPGDQKIAEACDGRVVVQVHTLDITKQKGGAKIATNVPSLAVFLPAGVSQALFAQTSVPRTRRRKA